MNYVDGPELNWESGFLIEGTFVSHDLRFRFCSTAIRRSFNIPKGVKKIQFRIYSEPGPNRFEVRIRGDYAFIEDEHGQYLLSKTKTSINWFLKENKFKKTFYVKVFYWE